ncbi:MAG: phosphotransferase [Chloroflexi bacterium]|nr:phosphotransferase [Chloroflexota bacterium]
MPWLVHWDLWDGNVFVDPASGEINGIIDFERALWGDPLIELNFREYSDASAFGEGYGKAVLDTSARRLRRSLYDLYLYLIMVIEDDFRQYETHEITDWARGNLVRVLEELGL